MPTRPDQSFALAARQAKSADVVKLFKQLAARAETYATMQDEFLEAVIRHREARAGKPFHYTRRQERLLECFDEGAAQAERDIEDATTKMDDRTLLTSTLSSEYQSLELDETMASSYRPEDKAMALRMIGFRRETIRMIEEFVENSPFRGQVISIWHGKKKPKAV
jgi:hypothetical protein